MNVGDGALTKFTYTNVTRKGRYAIGIEEESGKYFISFPVRNYLVEAE